MRNVDVALKLFPNVLNFLFTPIEKKKRKRKREANAIHFWMGFGGCVECKSYLIFKMLLMLMECRILLMGNTVELAGGWHGYNLSYIWIGMCLRVVSGWIYQFCTKGSFSFSFQFSLKMHLLSIQLRLAQIKNMIQGSIAYIDRVPYFH